MFAMRTFHRLTAGNLAAVSLAGLCLLATACGTPASTPGSSKTVTATATPPAPTKTVTVTPSTAPCRTGDLRLRVGAANGAAGTIYYPIEFTNVSSAACTLYGYPGVSFVTAPHGTIIGAPAGRREIAGITPALITLRADATAHAILADSDVLTSNQCHQHQVAARTVQVYPPGQYTALFAPFSGTGCADRSLVVMWVSPVTSGS
jgi:Protein of unknown function (DUF4232)